MTQTLMLMVCALVLCVIAINLLLSNGEWILVKSDSNMEDSAGSCCGWRCSVGFHEESLSGVHRYRPRFSASERYSTLHFPLPRLSPYN